MPLSFYIHIGFHKTGTTFIQNYFRRTQTSWKQRGLLYPQTGDHPPRYPTSEHATRGHARLAREVHSCAQNARQSTLWRQLTDEISASGCNTVLLSSEIFSAVGFEGMPKALRQIIDADASVKIILYLRRQDIWIESLYKEILGWSARRETRDIESFIDQDGQDWLDYESRIEPWITWFGRENVIAKSYDDLPQGHGVLSDFFQTLSLATPPSDEPALPERTNPSIHPSMVDFLRAVNSLEGLSRGTKAAVTRTLLDTSLFSNQAKLSLLSNHMWTKLKDLYGPTNESLARQLMIPPTCNFLFPEVRPQPGTVEQRLPYEAAKTILQLINSNERALEIPQDTTLAKIKNTFKSLRGARLV